MADAASPKTDSSKYPMPFTRIEVVLMTLVDGNLAVLLARRAQAPYAGKWALPGGVLRIDLDGSLEEAAARVVRERLATDLPDLKQLCAVGGPTRDPRAPWGLSIVYRALSLSGSTLPTAGKRIEELRWAPVESLAKGISLAFDHNTLVARATDAMREDVEEHDLPYGLLPAHFTLTELQQTCEAVLGHALDKSSFRRRLNDRDLLEPVDGEKRGGAFRPAQLYQRRARLRSLR
ncbi:MAG: NUDIX domain-containing protein [Burkholderiales bacterium]|nr:NUDIX domain-containing protein [Burkholderiales bacterium]